LWAVAKRELFGELAIVVAKSSRVNGVRCSGGFGDGIWGVPLLAKSVLVREAVFAHDQRSQAVRERIDARARLRVRAFVGPDDVEARIDARYCEPVQGRVAEGERSQVVRVRELSGFPMLALLDSS
jgi:hypothetical protein